MILIGADFIPTKSNIELFEKGDTGALFGRELEEILSEADFRIFNLESPLCDILNPIRKNGKNFSAPSKVINLYKKAKTDLFTLSNNHILDQDEQGLFSTVDLLQKNGIAYVGAGNDPGEAAKPFYFSHNGKKIGVYACCENEFSIVSETNAGANPFDPLETPDHIVRLKKQCDYVIVLYHGGKEYYRYPTPLLQKNCRKLIEKGADLVVCQHSHCIGCEEKYLSGTIVYGQGNFLFDNSDKEVWQTGILIKIDDDGAVGYIPLAKSGNSVRLAEGEKAEEILNNFKNRSEEIKADNFVKNNYRAFAKKKINDYLYMINGRHSFAFRAVDKLSGHRLSRIKLRRAYGENEKLILKNYLECESLKEIISEGISDDNKAR